MPTPPRRSSPRGARRSRRRCPILLSPTDVTRLQRLLARFVDVIPKEYHNGVQNGAVVIPLEYKEAAQFTQQAQSLVNELAPVWRRDQNAAFTQYKPELVDKLGTLQKQIAQVKDQSAIEKTLRATISSILQYTIWPQRPSRRTGRADHRGDRARRARLAQQFPRRREGRTLGGSRAGSPRRLHLVRFRNRNPRHAAQPDAGHAHGAQLPRRHLDRAGHQGAARSRRVHGRS